tara:strand:- start:74 stop:289 length:216 start_codon:yes stop_codon:yes gene_type:complete
MRKDDSKKHVYMVQSRDGKASIAEKVADGRDDLINLDWTDSLVKPVWLQRAVWHSNRMENKFTQTRIIKVA